jgi:malonyl-CoA/methylmalonyl-CoA synthetase
VHSEDLIVSTGNSLPLVDRASLCGDRTALIDHEGVSSYAQLLTESARVALHLLDGEHDLSEARVAFLVPPGLDYVETQWGIWRAGGVAVPLALSHPRPELEHVIRDSDSEVLVCHPDFRDRLEPIADELGKNLLSTNDVCSNPEGALPAVDPSRRAMIVYTSGTTGKPKGAVMTHLNLAAQVESLIAAWGWTETDHILNVLPLHHVHGIVNILSCALWAGATCEMLPHADPDETWKRLAGGEVTLFMAVPTIYHRLIKAWEGSTKQRRRRLSTASSRLRLMVSGSAALPVSTLERWREITGQELLERYGMTEIGMALSNPLDGKRVAGTVGTPLPGVEVRLVDEEGRSTTPGQSGEIEVRGPAVFSEYWDNPQATAEAFRDDWFRTGDQAVVTDGRYRILGRQSVDIIKSGGFKISALEIEEALRDHPAIIDCAVVGIEDPEWGQRIAAAVVLTAVVDLRLEELQTWSRARLAPYKLPRDLKIVDDLPRNAMGKVFKPAVLALFEGE